MPRKLSVVACAYARSKISRLKPCGVCTLTNSLRGGVCLTNPSASTTLIVSLDGTAAIAPPNSSAASITSLIVRADTNGRAASCTKIISASLGKNFRPFAIEYCRSLPPTVTHHGLSPSALLNSCSTCAVSCAATTTIKKFTRSTLEKVFSVRIKIGSPQSSIRFLFTPPPMRLLAPAAGNIAVTIKSACKP